MRRRDDVIDESGPFRRVFGERGGEKDRRRSRVDGNVSVAGRVYRWVCPICGATSIGSAVPEDLPSRANNALIAHVRTTAGGDHGSRHALPDGSTRADFVDDVEVVAD